MVWVVPLSASRNLAQDSCSKHSTHQCAHPALPALKTQQTFYVKSIVIVIVIFSYYLIISSFC